MTVQWPYDDGSPDETPTSAGEEPTLETPAQEEDNVEAPTGQTRRRKKKNAVGSASREQRRKFKDIALKAIQLYEAAPLSRDYVAIELGIKSSRPEDLAIEALTTTREMSPLGDILAMYTHDKFDILMELVGKNREEHRTIWNALKALGAADDTPLPADERESARVLVDAITSIDSDTGTDIATALDLLD